MATRGSSDAATPSTLIAPVVKRKKRTSGLGEQERRERKRAIDREAQRSLREKTKTHIAELERTIEILRDQNQNKATANLLSEIEKLRAENERLRDVIDSVRSVIGGDVFSKPAPTLTTRASDSGSSAGGSNVGSEPTPPNSGAGPRAPKSQTMSLWPNEAKPPPPSFSSPQSQTLNNNDPLDFQLSIPPRRGVVDLDGMTVMSDIPAATDPNIDLNLDLEPAEQIQEEGNILDAPESPITAFWAPYMTETFGPGWRCPSPTVLHIGNPDSESTSTTSSPSSSTCPMWKKTNEIFGKVFQYQPGTSNALTRHPVGINERRVLGHGEEAGMLFRGIRDGWAGFNEWKQSPTLQILKSVDEYLFSNLARMDRLATAYKSFKLLKYYLNGTKDALEKVPAWLRPSKSQSSTSHPIAIDFFAWPTLRNRLLNKHPTIFLNQDFSHCYVNYLRFDWPFSLEDAFFYDHGAKAWVPSPLFERYHTDLGAWSVTEEFYKVFPDMRGDIEGDRIKFEEVF